MSVTSGLIKVTKKGATAPAKAPPFYSAVDNAVDNLPNKATPEQMIKELLKQKEVKAQELIDRGIDKKLGVPIVQKERTVKLKKPDAKGNTEKVEKYFEVTPGEKGAKAITKDEVINTVDQNPPKQITEDIMGEPTQKMIDQKIEELIEKEVRDELGPRPKYGDEREDWLEDYDRLIEQKSYLSNWYYDEAKEAIRQEGTWGSSKYDRPDWKLAGGENYREIVLKLPPTKSANQQRIMELEAYERRGATNKDLLDELARLRAERDAAPEEYKSSHWDQPNVLAHIRVQDRVGPNGEKVLHVEEIQSDWHQAGRKKGYATADIETRLKESEKELEQIGLQIRGLNNRMTSLSDSQIDEFNKLADERQKLYDRQGFLMDEGNALIDKRNAGVPDAPFKKNWHELAMKRLINYASENGYDKIAITPGAEQAKRYDLSKQIESVSLSPTDNGQYRIDAQIKDGGTKTETNLDANGVEEMIGKELASKLIAAADARLESTAAMRAAAKSGDDVEYDRLREARKELPPTTLSGLDLQVGGEGMIGFYDQMLPAYLNKYGEKYGAKVGQLPISSGEKMIPDNAGLGMIRSGEPELTQLHSFDITPQMREEVLTKGQPLYQQIGIPAATGAAGAEMLEDEPAFNRSEKVNITDNPDAMFLELNDQHFGVGGAAKKAVKAIKAVKGTQEILPAAEREANLDKFLKSSKLKGRVYHGTGADIQDFKPSKIGALGPGTYVTSSPKEASDYARVRNYERSEELPNVLPLYVQAENPFHIPSVNNSGSQFFLHFDPKGKLSDEEVIELAKKAGYDSVHADLEGVTNIFDPRKIKSAIGNRGTYDTTQPDINEARGGLATHKRK
jgi:hypothetical protein